MTLSTMTVSPQSAMPATARPSGAGRSSVTAVLVSHDGARWLPRTLAALTEQTRQIDLLVAVDTGSGDGSADLLRDHLGPARVLVVGRRWGFGAAVRAGLELADQLAADPIRADELTAERPGGGADWVWLVHDDAAPHPGALEHLLDAAAQSAQVGVVGPKLVDWDDPTLLLEAGVTVSRGGRRSSGVVEGERDQGQHDHRSDVLAVGTAGLLVRRDLWDRLGGLDPALPLLRDDVDLCWRAHLSGHRVVLAPRAVVADAQAATRGLRPVDAVRSPLRRVDRRHALHVVLARCPWPVLPLVLSWLLLSGVARALGLVAAGLVDPGRPGRGLHARAGHAADELLATLSVVLTPWTWLGSRWRARGTRSVRRRDVTGLLTPRWGALRGAVERLSNLAALDRDDHAGGAPPPTSGRSPRRVSRLLWHPLTSVLVLVGAAAVVADRRLGGAGALVGGELMAIDGRAGAPSDSPGAVVRAGAVALLIPLAGDRAAARVVDLLLLGAPVLAAVSAYAAAGLVARSRWVRGWAALVWATLPLLTGAVGAGRLGPVSAYLLLPVTAAAVARSLTGRDEPRRLGPWRATCAAATGLGLIGSALPALLVVALLVALAGLLVGRGGVRVRALLLAVLPIGLLGPWLAVLVDDPRLLIAGPGALVLGPAARVGPGDDPLAALAALAPMPAGWPAWSAVALAGPVLLAGLVGLLRGGRGSTVLFAAWLLALLGLGAAFAATGVTITTTPDGALHPWPGTGLAVLALVAVTSALVGADGLRSRLAAQGFGWRGLVVAPVVVAAALAPLAASGAWVWRGSDTPLHRDRTSLPAVALDAAVGPAAMRTLVLGGAGSAITYRLVGVQSSAWTRDLAPQRRAGSERAAAPVAAAVRSLLASPGEGAGVDDLRRLAVGFLVVEPGAPAQVSTALATVAGLTRLGSAGGWDGGGAGTLWRVQLAEPASTSPPPTSVGQPRTAVPDPTRRRWQLAQAGLATGLVVLAVPRRRRARR